MCYFNCPGQEVTRITDRRPARCVQGNAKPAIWQRGARACRTLRRLIKIRYAFTPQFETLHRYYCYTQLKKLSILESFGFASMYIYIYLKKIYSNALFSDISQDHTIWVLLFIDPTDFVLVLQLRFFPVMFLKCSETVVHRFPAIDSAEFVFC